MDLTKQGLREWWSARGVSAAQTVFAMDHRDYWAADRLPLVEGKVVELGEALSTMPSVRILAAPVTSLIILIGFTSSSVGLRIMHWLNEVAPRVAREVIIEAEARSTVPSDTQGLPQEQRLTNEAARIVMCRTVHLERNAVIRRVFGDQNRALVLEAVRRTRASLLARRSI